METDRGSIGVANAMFIRTHSSHRTQFRPLNEGLINVYRSLLEIAHRRPSVHFPLEPCAQEPNLGSSCKSISESQWPSLRKMQENA